MNTILKPFLVIDQVYPIFNNCLVDFAILETLSKKFISKILLKAYMQKRYLQKQHGPIYILTIYRYRIVGYNNWRKSLYIEYSIAWRHALFSDFCSCKVIYLMKSYHLEPHSRFILQETVIIAIRKIKTTAKIHMEISV